MKNSLVIILIMNTMKNSLNIIIMETLFHMIEKIIMEKLKKKIHKMNNPFHCQIIIKYMKTVKL